MSALRRPTARPSGTPSLNQVLIELDKRKAERSFAEFVKAGWHVLEPSAELKWGWSLDAVCDHLTAVSYGDIQDLLINVPPGCMKSLLTGVFFPAWEWGPRNMPNLRYLGTAHKEPLAIRDNRKCRQLIQSEWFQSRWGENFNLTSDQNEKRKFENDKTGFREAMAFTSMTGSRGDRVLLDDPHSVDEGNSDADLLAAEYAFTETLPTRVNNEQSATIVIMQRIHERDVSGIILEREFGFVHLMLPMEFEPERKCHTVIGFEDPRTKDGELLFPDRFSADGVAKLKKKLGEYAVAGQLQQRPTGREGGLFKRDWFNEIEVEPEHCLIWVRGWDFAAGVKKRNDYTAHCKLGITREGRIIIAHADHAKRTPAKVKKWIKELAEADDRKARTVVSYPQDPGQAGKSQKMDIAVLLTGHEFKSTTESGDKEVRAGPINSQCEAGMVDIVKGPWNKAFLDEVCMFPGGAHDDFVDALSRAYNELARRFQMDMPAVGQGPKVMGEAA